ncbi:cupin domain-containing protein [Ideonella sp.]|uniref:AraC family transcriptional regulator n=1 Tax=Ideonella sp. TaxID=1929293 RepID=UPI003BB4BCF7
MDDDLLGDVLRDTGLRRRVLNLNELPVQTGLRFPCDRSIGLHLAVRGPLHVHAPGLATPLLLQRGDIALMARGCDHVLSQAATLDGVQIGTIGTPVLQAETLHDGAVPGAVSETSAVFSGAYQFWTPPIHPFFAEMPAWLLLRAADLPQLGPIALTTSLIEAELGDAQPGRAVITQSLLDVLFAYALRHATAQCAQARQGWSHAARDPQIHRALALMHAQCEHPWTLEELAQRVGLSRTALAERFREALGDTPLNHLRTLRMQRAMQLLSNSELRLEAVAAAVGYQDAFGFSKVFKRTLGLSPREFRQQDAAEQGHPWRFKAG